MAASKIRVITKIREEFETDENIRRAGSYTRRAARACPSASTKYLADKLPILRWLPNYSYKWVLRDVIAGITVGMLLIPQALAYAKIARIPLTSGLLASWLGPALYALMGTTKDVVSGPTTIVGLLTGTIVRDLAPAGFTPQAIAGGISFVVGICALIVGCLKLGFILDFVSLPVLNGFFSAACLNIIFSQTPSLFGLKVDGSSLASIIQEFFAKLPQTRLLTFVIGVSSIALLVLMQYAGRRLGNRFRNFWILSLCRNAIVLIVFTGISYGVNRNLKVPRFAVAEVSSVKIESPAVPSTTLIARVAGACMTVFLAISIEHLAMARAFGRRNGYTIDESQELCFLGVSNFINGFFFTMPIGGGISRTAVNSDSGVKSPLGGLATSASVIISIYQLTGALYWIPKATLAAILVTAVWQIIPPIKTFYSYWRTSLADFLASIVCFWLTLFISVEIGIAAGVGFSVLHLLLRTMFTRLTPVTSSNLSTLYPDQLSSSDLPSDTKVFKFSTSIVFTNAYRTKNTLLNTVQVYNSGVPITVDPTAETRLWSEDGNRQIEKMREQAGITEPPPRLRIVVLDLECVAFIDVTGLQALQDAKNDLRMFAGEDFELRFVGMSEDVRSTFERSGWRLAGAREEFDSELSLMGEVDLVFESMQSAVSSGRVERGPVQHEPKVD